MEKLKPCPFCGGEAAQRDFTKPFVNGWVGCQKCHCFINWVKGGKPEAVAVWNRRAAPEIDELSAYRASGLNPKQIEGLKQSTSRLQKENTELRAAPENKPLTLDELRGMDGEPVWIVEAPDWGHWELSERAEDYLDDRDPDFYGMKHDDPAGRYGLHVLGWLAFARRPEGSAPKAK